jgi:hypothetical protein
MDFQGISMGRGCGENEVLKQKQDLSVLYEIISTL